jgi:hypothetical protein
MMRPADREKFVRIIGMTASKFDAEALAALRLANRMLRQHGMTWRDVVGLAPEPEHVDDPRQGDFDVLHDWPSRWSDAVAYCATNADALNEASAVLIEQLAHYQITPSERQLAWLRRCVLHLQRGGQA